MAARKNPEDRVRYKFIDTARISLMVLGVFYHAALMFNIDYDWMVNFDTRELALAKFVQLVHLFRMEAFFVIAAFLAASVLNKYDNIVFLKKRFVRLIVPFGVGFILTNFVVVPAIKTKPLVADQLFHMHHLWFLIVLFVAALLHQAFFMPRHLQRCLPKSLPVPIYVIVPLIFIVASICIATLRYLSLRLLPYRMIYESTHGFLDIGFYVHYLPFYFLGAVLYNYREHIDRFLKCWPLFILMAAIYFSHISFLQRSWTVAEIFVTLATLSLIALVLVLFRFVVPQSFSRPWMSNYSYSMYLIHQPLLYLLRDPIMNAVKNSYLRFALISLITIAVCTFLHLIIARSRVLSFLFNGELKGKGLPRKEVSAAQPN